MAKAGTVTIKIESKYGRKLFYPTNSYGDTFAKLIGKTTLTSDNLKMIEELGFKIEVETDKEWRV